jgi:hypothetical protein
MSCDELRDDQRARLGVVPGALRHRRRFKAAVYFADGEVATRDVAANCRAPFGLSLAAGTPKDFCSDGPPQPPSSFSSSVSQRMRM